jgi:1-pyrroline-4-hydroxy-2-carboxylate deaminase
MQWTGVMPALTTAFKQDLTIDHDFVARHAQWQIENGVSGLIALGSLSEAATLTFDEKLVLVRPSRRFPRPRRSHWPNRLRRAAPAV